MLHYPFHNLDIDAWGSVGVTLSSHEREDRPLADLMEWPLAWIPQVRHMGHQLCLHPDDSLRCSAPGLIGSLFGVTGWNNLLVRVDDIGPDADISAVERALIAPDCVVECDLTQPQTPDWDGGPLPLIRFVNSDLAGFAASHLAWLRTCFQIWQANVQGEADASEAAAHSLAQELKEVGLYTTFWEDKVDLLLEFGCSRGGAMLLESTEGRSSLPVM